METFVVTGYGGGFTPGTAAGCVAVRKWRGRDCEMKRLFVRAAFRGSGSGVFLAERAIEWARGAGYTRMVLDTLPSMGSAQRLYERLGFRDIPAYRFNPVPGTRYMARLLLDPGSGGEGDPDGNRDAGPGGVTGEPS